MKAQESEARARRSVDNICAKRAATKSLPYASTLIYVSGLGFTFTVTALRTPTRFLCADLLSSSTIKRLFTLTRPHSPTCATPRACIPGPWLYLTRYLEPHGRRSNLRSWVPLSLVSYFVHFSFARLHHRPACSRSFSRLDFSPYRYPESRQWPKVPSV